MLEQRICYIPGYEEVKDYYYITDTGNVISMKNNIPHILADRLSGVGYYYALLSTKEQNQRQELISRIVAKAFIFNNNPEKNIVHHIDGNKLNNHVNNLMWVTYEQNVKYSIMERNYIPGQISLLDEKPIVKYIILTKPNKKQKTITNQLSII